MLFNVVHCEFNSFTDVGSPCFPLTYSNCNDLGVINKLARSSELSVWLVVHVYRSVFIIYSNIQSLFVTLENDVLETLLRPPHFAAYVTSKTLPGQIALDHRFRLSVWGDSHFAFCARKFVIKMCEYAAGARK